MAFIIKNIDTVNIEIGDLGITLLPGEEYNLAQDEAKNVATSVDLPAAITAGSIRVLDPLDNTTQLNLANSLTAVSLANDTHWRIKGGFIDQLEDVDSTGRVSGDYLRFNGTNYVTRTPANVASDIQGSISHTSILNIGTNTHTQIDTHLASTTNPHSTSILNLTDTNITGAAKGDILVHNGSNWVDLTVGTNGYVLAANNATATGVEWQPIASSEAINYWEKINADIGSAVATAPRATLNLIGGNKITTTAVDGSPDNITIDWTNQTLAELTDVAIGSPVGNNYSLKYDATTGKWYPAADTPPPPSGSEFSIQLLWGPIPRVEGTTQIPKDDTPPLITEGTELWSRAMTLQSADSTVRIASNITFSASTTSLSLILAIFRGNVCVGVGVNSTANKSEGFSLSVEIYDEPGTVGPHTYSMRVGKTAGAAGTWYINHIHSAAGTIYFIGTGSPQLELLTRNSYTIEEIGVVN